MDQLRSVPRLPNTLQFQLLAPEPYRVFFSTLGPGRPLGSALFSDGAVGMCPVSSGNSSPFTGP